MTPAPDEGGDLRHAVLAPRVLKTDEGSFRKGRFRVNLPIKGRDWGSTNNHDPESARRERRQTTTEGIQMRTNRQPEAR